jgi:hypothetical protein
LSHLQGWPSCPHDFLQIHRRTCPCEFPLRIGPDHGSLPLP